MKFLIVAFLTAIVPMGLVGLQLTRGATSAGEDLLRGQLEEALSGKVAEVDRWWPYRRGDLLLLAENAAVVDALRDPDPAARADAAVYLAEAYSQMRSELALLSYRDTQGRIPWSFRSDASGHEVAIESGDPAAPAVPSVRLELPIVDPSNGSRLGALDAHLEVESLLSLDVPITIVPGAVFTVFDVRSGHSLLPTPVDAEALVNGPFAIEGADWIGLRRRVDGLPIELAIAAPTAIYVDPFRRSARTGVLSLLAVLVAGAISLGLLTKRLTASLEDLAVAADAVAAGELDRRVDVSGRDEVGRVARAFNSMTAGLRATLRRLSQQEAMAAAGEFAVTLAHEVRNPLTSVRIDLQRARSEAGADTRIGSLLARSLRQVDRLNETMEGALRLARSGEVRGELLDLRGPLRAAVRTVRPEYEQRGIALAVDVADGTGVMIRGDANALEQLFLNLLLNAAQAFEPGAPGARVEVSLAVGEGRARVAIADNGPGMPEETAARVFEPFYSTKAEGTGLGLAICNRIAHAHGGEIALDSRVGKGTRIGVILPSRAG
ncbi:MAG: HAMP domain-containing sensor histidine kinase [Gemmatimonadota bacterium]|nr:HAMP domain-containing sensor histidine kinase [Gemmatimonadota bacterium]